MDYQLAPEAKYPVQIEEIEYSVRWLFDHANEQGVDATKIGVGGDSAGGNMTCVMALKLRDENGPRLALQVPLFPEAAFPATQWRSVRTARASIWSPTESSRWCAIW
jgi:acetyl esterase